MELVLQRPSPASTPDGAFSIPGCNPVPPENGGMRSAEHFCPACDMICVPTSLAQEVGEVLGAQAYPRTILGGKVKVPSVGL